MIRFEVGLLKALNDYLCLEGFNVLVFGLEFKFKLFLNFLVHFQSLIHNEHRLLQDLIITNCLRVFCCQAPSVVFIQSLRHVALKQNLGAVPVLCLCVQSLKNFTGGLLNEALSVRSLRLLVLRLLLRESKLL